MFKAQFKFFLNIFIFIFIIELLSLGTIIAIKLVNRQIDNYNSKLHIKTKIFDLPHPLFKRQMPINENWIYDPNHAFYEFTHSNSAPYSYDENKDINDLRIFFLGGSSMLGVGANGFEQTIPGIYKKLAESLNCSKNLFIYNDGNNGYSPKLDFIKLSTKIIQFGKPDIVISMQGVNNYSGYSGYRPLDKDKNAPVFSSYWITREQQIYELLNSNKIFFNNLKKYFYTKFFLGHLTEAILNKMTFVNYVKAGYDSVPNYKIATENYFHYINLTKDLSEGNNFKFYNFLQPSIHLKKYPSQFEKNMLEIKEGSYFGKYPVEVLKNYWIHIDEFYDYIRLNQKPKMNDLDPWFFDISEVFMDVNENTYVDPTHYNPVGNKIIANVIFQKTKKDLLNLCR
tara:strand:- start:519 stop:1709 length:1191 start_codon:yes stop_codon:yes gene_type:complete